MRKKYSWGVAAVAAAACLMSYTPAAHAGAKITINDDSDFELGFRVQALYLNNDTDRTSNEDEFKVRRARFRLKGNVTKYFSGFLQTEFANEKEINAGGDMRLIDAWIIAKAHTWFNIVAGQQMAPVTRQGMTSSGGLMAIDRPGINNYMMTWGSSGRSAFNNGSLAGTANGLSGDVNVRDLGVMAFGSGSFSDTVHLKYYLGMYEGSIDRVGDPERYSARVQLNLFDAEAKLFNLSTYLGKKKTVAFAVGYDTQSDVAVDFVTGDQVDYSFLTFDAFVDYPVGPGTLTAEAAYNELDLDGGSFLADVDGVLLSTSAVTAKQSEGDGFYLQTGYLIQNWQPWIMYEEWNSNGDNGAGSWDALRFGVNYYFKGHNANVKAGYEIVSNDTPGEDDIDTFVVGIYLTY
jgi:hypothetical protein